MHHGSIFAALNGILCSHHRQSWEDLPTRNGRQRDDLLGEDYWQIVCTGFG